MKISTFQVQKYRSIKRAETISLAPRTVLVGPNNEGKSNILRALVVGLEALGAASASQGRAPTAGVLRRRLNDFRAYNWDRDFPVDYQAQTPGASSVFEYEFEFDEADIDAFVSAIGHKLNGTLKLRVLMGAHNATQIKVVKRGPANAALNDKVARIAKFVAGRLRVEYIPADRTFERSQELVSREARQALAEVQQADAYREALRILTELETQALAPLERKILDGLEPFMDVASVRLQFQDFRRYPDSRVEVSLDDGTLTALSSKGDGVQSLVAIALMSGMAPRDATSTLILALEEPEAHLHPGAVRELNRSLDDLSTDAQIVLTTHSPVLVTRDQPSANVLVRSNSALAARSTMEIRESLGIELPDNLMSSEVMLLVEGRHDVTVLRHLILRRGDEISNALRDGRLSIRSMEGAKNCAYEYRLARDSLNSVHVVLDDDGDGRRSAKTLIDGGAPATSISMLSARPDSESELEDILDQALVDSVVVKEFEVEADGSANPHTKFSNRAKYYFNRAGRPWSDSVASSLKSSVARTVTSSDGPILSTDGARVFESICTSLSTKLRVSGGGLKP